MTINDRAREQVLVLAPHGRDAALAVQLLQRHGVAAVVCVSVDDIVTGLSEAGCALLTQEALARDGLARVTAALSLQPAWSDFPFILLASAKGEPARAVSSAWRTLGNVTVLERPTQSRTLLSAVGAALRARRRQYEVREAIQRRDQFLAMLGHELRNPLAAIALAVETDTSKQEANRRQREIIARQTRHLSRLVDDLLDVARVTTGKVVLHEAQLDLNEVLLRCLEGAELRAQDSAIELVRDLWPEPLIVRGDAVRLEEVVNNLLWNAIKYSPPDSRVEASTRLEAGRAVLEVKDTGIGIPPNLLPRVFDLFAQGEVSLDRTRAGLGIGLTLVKSLVELHGGSVAAQSAGVGAGSRFTISLPLVEHPTALPRAPDSSARSIAASPVAPLPVLVVDDNIDLAEMAKQVLESFGCQVQTANDGPTGLAQLAAFQPALAFIDIGLPGRDGYSLATEVRAGPARQPWLVALTGYGQPEDQRRALAAGFNRHLTKPVSIEALRQAVDEANQAWSRQQLG
jgi:signal transduction histidine kinase/CheY-like chemotaxis protein